MSEHTPGPWSYDPEINRVFSETTNLCVAVPHVLGNPVVMEAWPIDARLIAAAPELLALAKQFRTTIAYYIKVDKTNGDDEGAALKSVMLSMVDDVIAKAQPAA